MCNAGLMLAFLSTLRLDRVIDFAIAVALGLWCI